MQAENTDTPKKKAAAKKSADAKTVKKAAVKKAAAKKTVSKDAVTINFEVIYGTRFGQNIFIAGNHPLLGNGNEENALKLQYIDHEHWGVEIKLSIADLPKDGLKYFYIVENEDGSTEKTAAYHLHINDLTKYVHITDAWNYSGFTQHTFSAKLHKVLSDKIAASEVRTASGKGTHKFKVAAPEMPAHHAIFLLGSSEEFGDWNTANIILLTPDKETGTWTASLSVNLTEAPVEYKYGIYDLDKKLLVAFEEGANRTLTASNPKTKHHIINDGFLRSR